MTLLTLAFLLCCTPDSNVKSLCMCKCTVQGYARQFNSLRSSGLTMVPKVWSLSTVRVSANLYMSIHIILHVQNTTTGSMIEVFMPMHLTKLLGCCYMRQISETIAPHTQTLTGHALGQVVVVFFHENHLASCTPPQRYIYMWRYQQNHFSLSYNYTVRKT